MSCLFRVRKFFLTLLLPFLRLLGFHLDKFPEDEDTLNLVERYAIALRLCYRKAVACASFYSRRVSLHFPFEAFHGSNPFKKGYAWMVFQRQHSQNNQLRLVFAKFHAIT